MDSDILEGILELEEKFYREGYDVGLADGARAGYTEGSVFAVEKGFSKALEVGKLYGKALVWNQRLVGSHASNQSGQEPANPVDAKEAAISLYDINKPTGVTHTSLCREMPALHEGTRVAKNIKTLVGLVDPATTSLENTEDAVTDMEERLKGAQLKAKLIQRSLGESDETVTDTAMAGNKETRLQGDGSGSIEDISSLRIRH